MESNYKGSAAGPSIGAGEGRTIHGKLSAEEVEEEIKRSSFSEEGAYTQRGDDPNAPPRNVLFQYSLISALMDGVASKGIPIKSVLEHGDFGLGTFANLQGELIILNKKAYRMNSDGTVVPLDPDSDIECPFVMVTQLQPQVGNIKHLSMSSKEAVLDEIDGALPRARNHLVAVLIRSATIKSITVRTVGGQEKPHEGLVEVGKHQTSRTFENTEGTLVGFRCPDYLQGVSVAGLHLHYISKDLQHGGHVLDLDCSGCVSLAKISKFQLELPDDDGDFDKAKLVRDDEGIKAVEGSGGGKWDDPAEVKGEHVLNEPVKKIRDALSDELAQSLREEIGDDPPSTHAPDGADT